LSLHQPTTNKLNGTAKLIYNIHTNNAWSPHHVKDSEVLERVQKTAKNLVPQLRKYSYLNRSKKLRIMPLTDRRERGDMIEVFKLLTGRERIDYEHFSALPRISRVYEVITRNY